MLLSPRARAKPRPNHARPLWISGEKQAASQMPGASSLCFQVPVKPVERLVLHRPCETVRHIVEPAGKLLPDAGFGVRRGELIDRFLHAFRRKQAVLRALLDE